VGATGGLDAEPDFLESNPKSRFSFCFSRKREGSELIKFDVYPRSDPADKLVRAFQGLVERLELEKENSIERRLAMGAARCTG
jgi:hypothetical protein